MTRTRRLIDRWIIEALICAELVVIANVFVMAGVVYALEYVARGFERWRVSGRRRHDVDRSPIQPPMTEPTQRRRRVQSITRSVRP